MASVQGVRYLIYIPDVPDAQIQYFVDNGYSSDIDIAIALADYMTSQAATSTDIKVGPITISGSQSTKAWNELKKDLILRKNTGAGTGGGSIGSMFGAVGSVTMTGVAPPTIQRGQFNNPPVTMEDIQIDRSEG